MTTPPGRRSDPRAETTGPGDHIVPYGLLWSYAGTPPSAPPLSRRRQVLLAVGGLILLVGGGVCVAMVALRGDEPGEVPPARTVAGAYWAAAERKDLTAMRRVLCDDDRVLLARVGDTKVRKLMFPADRRVLGYTITGQQDQPTTVIFVQVVREQGGQVQTVTRPTPVVERGGMYMVCFHSAGLHPTT
jgi:hypothetical protein